MPQAFARSIYPCSVGLDLALEDAWTRASPSASRDEDTAATARRMSPLFLLSTFPAPSRSQSGNVTALRRPLAFLRCCRLFFRRGINERPSALDRQLHTPTKGRIRNTPKVTGDQCRLMSAPSKNVVRPTGPVSRTSRRGRERATLPPECKLRARRGGAQHDGPPFPLNVAAIVRWLASAILRSLLLPLPPHLRPPRCA